MQADKQSVSSDTGAEKQKEHKQNTKKKNYYCRSCNKHVVSEKHPRKLGRPLDDRCPAYKSSNSSHDWTDMGYVGDYKSTCKHCGLTVWHEKQFLHSMLCSKQGKGQSHDWKPLN